MLEIFPISYAMLDAFHAYYAGIIGTSLYLQSSKMFYHRTYSDHDPFQYSQLYIISYDQFSVIYLFFTVATWLDSYSVSCILSAIIILHTHTHMLYHWFMCTYSNDNISIHNCYIQHRVIINCCHLSNQHIKISQKYFHEINNFAFQVFYTVYKTSQKIKYF